MTNDQAQREEEELCHAVQLRKERRARWRRQGERSLWQNLSMIGALGWLIVAPTLLALAIGRWLDRTFASGVFFSGALIVVGVAVGSYLAWQRVNREKEQAE